VDVTSLSFTTYPSFVELHACGLDAGFTLSGAATTARDASGGGSAQPYVDGGVLEQVSVDSGGTVGSVLHGADGAIVGTYPGQVLQPLATDGTSSDLVLTGSGGVPLQALARDGSVRWKSTHTYAEVLVRTAGVIVAQRNDLAISGLDPATGAVLWTDDGLLTGDPTTGTHDDVKAAFTDGSVALLVIANEGGTATALVALDLASGEVRWRFTPDGFWPQLTAVDGRLVQIVGNQGSRYQDDGHGGSIRLDPGTVTALG
jgi:outer membrane protein assembly factor BamB